MQNHRSKDPKVEISATEARAGRTPHVVRYVLAISLILVILGFASAYMFGWLSWQAEVEEARQGDL